MNWVHPHSWGWELIFPQKYVQKVRIGLKPHFPITETSLKGSSCLCHLIISSTKFWKNIAYPIWRLHLCLMIWKKYITELPLARCVLWFAAYRYELWFADVSYDGLMMQKQWVHDTCWMYYLQLYMLYTLRASPQVLNMFTLQTYFSRPSLVIYIFATPPIKLKWGLQIGGKLLITSHVDQSWWLANRK
jgi:hypothetical protein